MTGTSRGRPGQHAASGDFRSPTEDRNPRTTDIDTLPAEQIVARILSEDAAVVAAVSAATADIGRLAAAAVESIRAGGRVHYVGAGTSGRLGVLDAVELLPTYGVGEEWFAVHLAGGAGAMFKASEGAEDDADLGRRDTASVRSGDLVIGLAASGRTPYVRGAIQRAREVGARSALLTANPYAELLDLVDIPVVLNTGPEVVTGSTRMKAATAQKIALNAFSTATMIRLGKTYSNLMVDVSPSNEKLRARVVRLLMQATSVDAATATRALESAEGDLKVALVALLAGAPSDPHVMESARHALTLHGGVVHGALADLTTATPEETTTSQPRNDPEQAI